MNKSKVTILVLFTCFLSIVIIGCGMKPTTDASTSETEIISLDSSGDSSQENLYDAFLEDYNNILDNYKPKGMTAVDEMELQHWVTAFPENSYFPQKDDIYNNNSETPKKKNLYYVDEQNHFLIYITHIYLDNTVEKTFLTADTPKEECIYDNVSLPNFEEYYMCYHNTLVNFKVFYIGQEEDKSISSVSGDYVKEYISLLK